MLNYPTLAKAALVKYKRWSKAKTIKERHRAQLSTQIFITEKLLEEIETLQTNLQRTRNALSAARLQQAIAIEAWKEEITEHKDLVDLFIKTLKQNNAH